MSKVYLIGDTHWGHRNICKYRGMFSSPEEHDEFLFENIMGTLTKRDTIWLMGDTCFTREAFEYVRQINDHCQSVHWILGNHCTENRDRQENVGVAALIGVKLHSLISYKGAWLCHHPIHPVELRGKFCLHGHVHTQTIREHGYFNCSAENLGFKPREFVEVKDACDKDDWGRWSI